MSSLLVDNLTKISKELGELKLGLYAKGVQCYDTDSLHKIFRKAAYQPVTPVVVDNPVTSIVFTNLQAVVTYEDDTTYTYVLIPPNSISKAESSGSAVVYEGDDYPPVVKELIDCIVTSANFASDMIADTDFFNVVCSDEVILSYLGEYKTDITNTQNALSLLNQSKTLITEVVSDFNNTPYDFIDSPDISTLVTIISNTSTLFTSYHNKITSSIEAVNTIFDNETFYNAIT